MNQKKFKANRIAMQIQKFILGKISNSHPSYLIKDKREQMNIYTQAYNYRSKFRFQYFRTTIITFS